MTEGRVSARQGDSVDVDITGLGRFSLPASVLGDVSGSELGRSFGIAVRPEKVRIHRTTPGQDRITLRGRVSQIAYYGDTSHVFVALEGGQTISANLQNEARSTEPAIEVSQELWCSWNPRDTLILED